MIIIVPKALLIKKIYKAVKDGEIRYPVFVKPVKSSASLLINKAYNEETIEFLMTHNDGLMIQELLDGQEIGADCYIDIISGEVVFIFTKKKILMRLEKQIKVFQLKMINYLNFLNDSSKRVDSVV